jgi:hypothetical protein
MDGWISETLHRTGDFLYDRVLGDGWIRICPRISFFQSGVEALLDFTQESAVGGDGEHGQSDVICTHDEKHKCDELNGTIQNDVSQEVKGIPLKAI